MKPVYQTVNLRHALFSTTAVLAVGVLIYLIFKPNISLFGDLGWASLWLGVAGGILGYFVVFVFTKAALMKLSHMRDLMQMLASMFRDFSWPAILIVSVMAGISEELLLRGLLQHYLVAFTNPAVGILLASLVFGLMHFLSRLYVVVTFVLGLAFGVAYHLTDSLALVVIAHAAYDVCAFAVLVKYPNCLNIKTSV